MNSIPLPFWLPEKTNSLRDMFALVALNQLMANDYSKFAEVTAMRAYLIADAMMTEREKKETP